MTADIDSLALEHSTGTDTTLHDLLPGFIVMYQDPRSTEYVKKSSLTCITGLCRQLGIEIPPLDTPPVEVDFELEDAGLVATAEATLDRLARGEETTISLEEWEQRQRDTAP